MDGPVFGEGAVSAGSGGTDELNDFERRFGGLFLSNVVVIARAGGFPSSPVPNES